MHIQNTETKRKEREKENTLDRLYLSNAVRHWIGLMLRLPMGLFRNDTMLKRIN